MSNQRQTDYNEKFLYSKTNPEKIISSPKGGWFFRKGNEFYVNPSGDVNGVWTKLPYRTVVLPRPSNSKLILFEQEMELWVKNSDGFIDRFEVLHPKTDWKFLAYGIDVFFKTSFQATYNWLFPPPSNTNDPVGIDGSRSFDENYFYARESGSWYRTPIAIFDFPSIDVGEVAYWYNNLPFVDAPRRVPAPSNSNDLGAYGQQSYDADFFYIKVSKWKRAPLIYFNPSKMAVF